MAAVLDAFERSDVSVSDALAHLTAKVDRARLLTCRMASTSDAGRDALALVGAVGSALLLDAFVAEAFDRAGAHADALAVRLDALAVTPRWDAALAARLLSRTSATLRALGRTEEALAVATRALAFMPAEPRVVAEVAAALDATGRAGEAAAHRAFLYDIGVGGAVLAGGAGDAERRATAYVPDLSRVEALDDEGAARHLVASYLDIGLANHMLQGRRHAMACVRHGVDHAALGTLNAYAGGTPNASDAGRWIGWPVGATDYVATDALLAAVDARVAGTKTVKDAKALRHSLPGARADAAEALAKAGRGDLARECLFDRVAFVRYRAAKALPDDPLVARVRAVEAALPASMRLFDRDAMPDGLQVQASHHGHEIGGSFPVPPSSTWPIDLHAPHIEVTPNARSKCKLCKAPLSAGELRLRVRHKHFPVETLYTHLSCAASGKRGPLLASSAMQREEGPLLAVALGRSRLQVPDRDALLAACDTTQPPKKKAKK